MVELWGNDLLNQNSGFSRNAQANLITQTTYNTLKRYFMLTINYEFTKMAGGAPKQQRLKKKILLFASLLIHVAIVSAQYAHFITSGTIEFEKRTNAYALIQKMINKDNEAWMQPAFDYYKKNNPQFRTMNAKLEFSNDNTLYTPKETDLIQNGLVGDSPMLNQFNTIFTDLGVKKIIDQKKVFEQTYLITDSTRKIK